MPGSDPSSPATPPQQAVPPGLPAPGEVFAGKYVVERLLGVGGMGAVLLARHVELDEQVAIKTLLPGATAVASAGEAVARFIREARAAIKIRNEHVVRILDVGRLEDGAPYIVMEYLHGSDLAQLTEGGPLTVEDAVEYVVQACEAIAAAHALGIVHRDLKPANLFLARTGDGHPCVKVLDFGISKIAESSPGGGASQGLTSTTTIMGTPCFMSPEQLRSTRDVDARADIWSMGAILHALLTGAPPYEGESNADVSAKIIRDLPTPVRQLRAEVPLELEAIILRCLAKDPAARFADVAELAQALASVVVRPSVQASAARVVRSAVAAAPTLTSTPPPPPASPGVSAAAASGPTRTASAWGETGREDRKRDGAPRTSRRLAGAIGAIAVAGGVVVLGLVRWQHPSPPAPAAASSTPQVTEIVAPVPPPSTPPIVTPPVVTPAPGASFAGPTASTSTAPSTRPGLRHPPIPTVKPEPTAATAPLPPPPAPKPSSGLFDGRE